MSFNGLPHIISFYKTEKQHLGRNECVFDRKIMSARICSMAGRENTEKAGLYWRGDSEKESSEAPRCPKTPEGHATAGPPTSGAFHRPGRPPERGPRPPGRPPPRRGLSLPAFRATGTASRPEGPLHSIHFTLLSWLTRKPAFITDRMRGPWLWRYMRCKEEGSVHPARRPGHGLSLCIWGPGLPGPQ